MFIKLVERLTRGQQIDMNTLFLSYQTLVRRNLSSSIEKDDRDLTYWQGQLFYNFLVYCLPISLIALIPGVYMSLIDGFPAIAVVDLLCFALIATATFSAALKVRQRKILVIAVFYFLAIYLINALGYIGPGVFYLFFITVLIGLIFPVRYAYRSVGLNAAILGMFAVLINFKLANSALIAEYTTGKWIAFSVNLVFASTVIVLVIDKIFDGLQLTIGNKTMLEERYRLIFDKSPLPMWLFDTETFRFIDVNEAAILHYGYEKNEFLSMTIMDIRNKDQIPATADLVRAHELSGEFYGGNAQHVKKNGEMIYVKIESNLIRLNGRAVRLVQATDITTQVNHQFEVDHFSQRIKESEADLHALFDSAVDGVVLLDDHACIKLFNTKASRSVDFNKDQAVFEKGRSIFDFVENARLNYFKKVLARVYQGETVDYDRKFRIKGSIHWIRYTLNPVREGKKITGACITGRDITERKLYLRSVEEQNKVFREISWMQSHLVRAPLARILGLLPILDSETEALEKAMILGYIKGSANELDDIIKKITERSATITEKYPSLTEFDD